MEKENLNEEMKQNNENRIDFKKCCLPVDGSCFEGIEGIGFRGGFTRRDRSLPENGNMALHVCVNEEDVMINRRALAEKTVPLENWVLPWQKHTDRFVRITAEDAGRGSDDKNTAILETDGLYTTDTDLLIGVFTADCLGILIADETTGLVGAVHSGWKGTAQNILYKMLKEIFENKLAEPSSLKLYFSPSIQKSSFEIGENVKEQLLNAGREIGLDYSDLIEPEFDEEGSRIKEKYLADHEKMNIRTAESLGVRPENIYPGLLDTKTDETCFSFRRDREKTGEHFSFIYRLSDSECE